jgi:hypothetical protein
VRLNALKSVAREVQLMHELVAHYALAHPHVTLQLQHDGRRLLFTPASADVKQRLTVLFNRELATHMLAVDWQSIDLAVAGAVSAPLVHRGTRQRQYFWVNGRPIRSGLISAAVGRAYGMRLPPGRHPLVALGITLPPQFLDVNVHPRKQEVGFVHERAVFAAARRYGGLALGSGASRRLAGLAGGRFHQRRIRNSLWRRLAGGVGSVVAADGASRQHLRGGRRIGRFNSVRPTCGA